MIEPQKHKIVERINTSRGIEVGRLERGARFWRCSWLSVTSFMMDVWSPTSKNDSNSRVYTKKLHSKVTSCLRSISSRSVSIQIHFEDWTWPADYTKNLERWKGFPTIEATVCKQKRPSVFSETLKFKEPWAKLCTQVDARNSSIYKQLVTYFVTFCLKRFFHSFDWIF